MFYLGIIKIVIVLVYFSFADTLTCVVFEYEFRRGTLGHWLQQSH